MPYEEQTTAGVLVSNIPCDATVPDVPLHQYVMERMNRHATRNAIAFVDSVTKVEWTFTEVLDAVERLSTALQIEFDLQKGQVVALALPNSAEFIISVLAVSRCGGVASLINPGYTAREMENVIEVSGPCLWICAPEVLPLLGKLGRSAHESAISRAIVVGVNNPHTSAPVEAYSWHSVLDSGCPEEFVEPSFSIDEDLATLPYSSGTTGLPKGVMISHRNVLTSLCQFTEGWCSFTENDVTVGLLPMYHQMGCFVSLTSLLVGSRMVVISKFSFTGLLKAIQEHQISVIALVPPIAIMLAKLPAVSGYDLSSIKLIMCAAAPISPEIVKVLASKYGCDVMQGFGMTECFCSHVTPPDLVRQNNKYGSVGIVLPFFEAKVIDRDSGKTLGAGETGEICVRGPIVMKGYKGNPSATADTIDADGWLHTGDLGYYDHDGWFFIVGRLKELIKCKGHQVAPAELERIILQHSEVMDAAVIGIPDEMAGELPKAFVVKRPGSLVTEDEIANFLNDQVSTYKHLRGGLVFIDAIPKSGAGKILRQQLAAL